MSTGPKEPEDIVKDGVAAGGQADGPPAAREQREEGSAAAPEVGGSPEPGQSAGAKDANETTGPAEEQDEKAGDDRGLTTDSSPD
ncbi:MAG: hypothetical protein ABWX85_08820 [Arthrobacter sp.]